MLVVKTQIKEIVRECGTDVDNVSADFAEKLDKKVAELIQAAVMRAKENSRRTVMAKDL